MALSFSAPSNELAVELDEVRADAAALAAVFNQLNTPLPEDFPKDAVTEIANALRQLPDGTARGCLRPLNEAQSQLAAVRSQHIHHDDHSSKVDEDRPSLFRGEPVDQRLRHLMSSVSTALQTANRLASEEADPDVPEIGVLPPKDSSTRELIEHSHKSQQELESEREELDSIDTRGSARTETLRRRLTDALVLNWLGRGELRMPRIASARLRRIAASLREYPGLIRQAADLISKGTDVADYAYEKWHSLKKRVFEAGTGTIRDIADDISRYAKRLELRLRDGTHSEASNQTLPEFDIEKAVEMIHAGEAPPSHWLQHITTLPLGNRRLRQLTPIAGLKNLVELDKISVNARDFEVLERLENLISLDLSSTLFYDCTLLANLVALEHLNLEGTAVSDLKAISHLKSLRTISLEETLIEDISPLAGMKSLESLNIARSRVVDISVVTKLPNLRSLYIGGTAIDDFGALAKCTKLRTLSASNTKIEDLGMLSKLKNISLLVLDSTRVIDCSPLEKLPSLQHLYLNDTPVSDLGPISRSRSLEMVLISGTNVKSVFPLGGLKSLRTLYVDRTAIDEIDSLKGLSLEHLSIRDTRVKDLSPLEWMHTLKRLYIGGTRVIKIPGLLLQRKSLRIIRG